jgi:DNA polymerase III subunit delta'
MASGATLVFNGTEEKRKEKIAQLAKLPKLENSPDTLIIQADEGEKTIKLGQVKEGIGFVNRKPFEKKEKVLVILGAEKMTTEAQNALLKPLEEPPSYALIFLSAKTESTLLETVISRCRKFEIKNAKGGESPGTLGPDTPGPGTLENVKKMSRGQRMLWAQETSKEEREEIMEMLESWVGGERKHLSARDKKSSESAQNIILIDQVKNDLEKTSVNLKMALELLVLRLQ